MAVPIKTQATLEFAQLMLKKPTPEQILAFHPSTEVAERVYELIYTDREGLLTEEESRELDDYMALERIMRSLKLEARRQLEQQAS